MLFQSVSLFVPGRGLTAVRGPEVNWSYRRSDLPARGIIVEAVLRVQQADSEAIRYAMDGSLRHAPPGIGSSLPAILEIASTPSSKAAC